MPIDMVLRLVVAKRKLDARMDVRTQSAEQQTDADYEALGNACGNFRFD